MIGYIYITTNLKNGKKYIGSHHAIKFDPNYRGSGKILKRAIEKDGKENFKTEIIEKCDTEEELIEKEEYYINLYNAVDDENFYNLTYSGYKRGLSGYKPSEETKKQISESRKGQTFSEETKRKLSEKSSGKNNSMYGKHHSEETRKKMSNSHKGHTTSEETKQKIREHQPDQSGKNHPMYGKHRTEETKKKISKANIGKKRLEETKKKISEANKGKKYATNSIDMYDLDMNLIQTFNSIREVAKYLLDNKLATVQFNTTRRQISKCCKQDEPYLNYIWKYHIKE